MQVVSSMNSIMCIVKLLNYVLKIVLALKISGKTQPRRNSYSSFKKVNPMHSSLK